MDGKSDTWTGWYEDGKKKFVGDYLEGKPRGSWNGFYPNGQKKYEGEYISGSKLVNGRISIKKEEKLARRYFVCEEECALSHPLDRRGKIINSENFKHLSILTNN